MLTQCLHYFRLLILNGWIDHIDKCGAVKRRAFLLKAFSSELFPCQPGQYDCDNEHQIERLSSSQQVGPISLSQTLIGMFDNSCDLLKLWVLSVDLH